MDYWKLPLFAKYDIENGFLLKVKEEGDTVEFTVEAAMTYAHPLHPLYPRTLWTKIQDALIRDLPPDQPSLFWTKIIIVFPKVRHLRWIERKMRPHVDPDGSIDYGDMYSFTVEGDKSHLSGGWGEVEIVSDPIEVSEMDLP